MDDSSLFDLDVHPGQSIQIELQSSDPSNYPLKKQPQKQQAKLPPLITVKAEKG